MDNPWQLCWTIGPVTFNSQETLLSEKSHEEMQCTPVLLLGAKCSISNL